MNYNSTEYNLTYTTNDYLSYLAYLTTTDNPIEYLDGLLPFALPIYRSDLQNQYSKPMLWIGMYIAFASLLCILAMLADLLHGLRIRKFWIPSKYFKINATSLLLISIAMKLPVDLSGSMPGDVDQAAKLGSIAFMCTMMANLLPSLAAMNSMELLTNITALGILLITLVVNVCIQINTGVVSINETAQLEKKFSEQSGYLLFRLDSLGLSQSNKDRNSIIATVYVTILLVLLVIHVCSSLAILKSKQIINSKYLKGHDQISSEQSWRGLLSVRELQQHVHNYWIMAGSGSPQFIAACWVTTTASGVICVVVTILHTLTMFWTIDAIVKKDYGSDYKWSMLVILIVQFIGVIVGTIAPFCRCFATLSFKVSTKIISNHIKVFEVESYWTSKLSDWKQGLPFPFRSYKLKAFIHYSTNIIFKFCIEFQKTVVVVCKLIAVIPFFFMICVWYCFHCLKLLLKTVFRSSQQKFGILEENGDLTCYVLQLEDEMEFAKKTLEGLLKTVNHLIQKGEKKQPKDLKSLIAKNSTKSFRDVFKFDGIDQVPSLPSIEIQDCWSLLVVTLTTIAVSLPNIEKEHVDFLLKGVGEGLDYVKLVEETFHATDDYASVKKAAKALWQEVNLNHKWLGNELQKIASTSNQVDKTRQVIEWFRDTAKNMVPSAVGRSNTGGPNDDSTLESICANSMYSITKTILLWYLQDNNINDDEVSQKQMFDKLSTMIADIIAACLTNLPQVIVTKCHTSSIEKREANVQSAAQLLGETKQIITIVQERQPPNIGTNDMPFIGKWRAYLADTGNP